MPKTVDKSLVTALTGLWGFFWPCYVAYGIQSLDQGLNPRPLQWKHGVLTTEPSGRSLQYALAGQSSFELFPVHTAHTC